MLVLLAALALIGATGFVPRFTQNIAVLEVTASPSGHQRWRPLWLELKLTGFASWLEAFCLRHIVKPDKLAKSLDQRVNFLYLIFRSVSIATRWSG